MNTVLHYLGCQCCGSVLLQSKSNLEGKEADKMVVGRYSCGSYQQRVRQNICHGFRLAVAAIVAVGGLLCLLFWSPINMFIRQGKLVHCPSIMFYYECKQRTSTRYSPTLRETIPG
jgi:hypothetical protein